LISSVLLQKQIKDVFYTIWERIADIYQDKLEKAIGDTVNFLWVAGRHFVPSLLPGAMPERLRRLATSDQQNVKTCE